MAFVGNDHRELTSQERRGLHAALLIEVQRNFAVALGGEAIAGRSQTLANLAVTVKFAVHHQMHRAIRAGHGLTAVSQTDDRQTRVSERPLPITRRPDAGAVGNRRGIQVEPVSRWHPVPEGDEPARTALPAASTTDLDLEALVVGYFVP